jgi:hypothetical protein
MSKEEVLQEALTQGNNYGFISYDGLLDLTDEDPEMMTWLQEELEKMAEENKIFFELDF